MWCSRVDAWLEVAIADFDFVSTVCVHLAVATAGVAAAVAHISSSPSWDAQPLVSGASHGSVSVSMRELDVDRSVLGFVSLALAMLRSGRTATLSNCTRRPVHRVLNLCRPSCALTKASRQILYTILRWSKPACRNNNDFSANDSAEKLDGGKLTDRKAAQQEVTLSEVEGKER